MAEMKLSALVFLVLSIALVGCGGSTNVSSNSTSTSTESASGGEDEIQATPRGEWDQSGDVSVKITSVKTTNSLKYVGGTYSEETPKGEPRIVKAKQGGRYIYVRTVVENNGTQGLDLTCGGPIDAILVAEDQSEYSPVDGLSQIAGNPECNVDLGPGFKDSMTWAFLVPGDARPLAFGFADINDLDTTYSSAYLAIK